MQNNDEPEPARYTNSFLVKTLNNKGPSSTYIDEYGLEFIQFAAKQKGKVLELGAAYGFVAIEALKAGANYIANDLEPRHLNILYNNTPIDCRSRLTLLPGEFPKDLNLADDSIAGCYISRMLGYLEPENLAIGFEKLYRCLQANAKLFILSSTPYRALYRNIIPIYEQRIQKQKKWPGYFTGLKELVGGKYTSIIPDTMHFLDDKILSRELVNAGFIIEKAQLYERKDLSKKIILDQREGAVVIAKKPYNIPNKNK